MRRKFTSIASRAIFALVLIELLATSPSAFADNSVFVQVRTTKLRNAALHWAPAAETLMLGDKLTVLESKDGWFKVKSARGKTGYVHESTLTVRRTELRSGSSANTVDSSEAVLAGKGFNKQVEQQFAASNHLSFAQVDAVERLRVDDAEVLAFINGGGLDATH